MHPPLLECGDKGREHQLGAVRTAEQRPPGLQLGHRRGGCSCICNVGQLSVHSSGTADALQDGARLGGVATLHQRGRGVCLVGKEGQGRRGALAEWMQNVLESCGCDTCINPTCGMVRLPSSSASGQQQGSPPEAPLGSSRPPNMSSRAGAQARPSPRRQPHSS